MPWPVSFAKALGDCEASFSRLPVHPQAGSETRVQMSVVCLCVPRGWCSLENNFAVIQSRRGFTQPPVSVARLVIYIYSRAYVTYPCYKNVLKVYVKLVSCILETRKICESPKCNSPFNGRTVNLKLQIKNSLLFIVYKNYIKTLIQMACKKRGELKPKKSFLRARSCFLTSGI